MYQIILLLLLLLTSTVTFAEDSAGHDGHAEHKNLLAVEVGIASENPDSLRDKGLAVGLAYERRLTERFGVGGFVERTWGDFDIWVYGIPLSYRINQWKFFVAPGVEDPDGQDNEFLLRLGGEYAFDMGGWELAPQIKVDFVDGETIYLAGVAIGWGF